MAVLDDGVVGGRADQQATRTRQEMMGANQKRGKGGVDRTRIGNPTAKAGRRK